MFEVHIMQKFLIAFPIFVLYFTAGGVQCGYLMETAPVNNTPMWNCTESETECLFGCCPVSNGICCLDGKHCCKQGYICHPFAGICIGVVNNTDQVSLESKKAINLRSSVLTCPTGMSEFAAEKCCPYKQAVSCGDGEHCCPDSYRCDVPNNKCISNSSATSFEKPLRRMSAKSPYKSCAGGHRMCPGYMDCCVNDNGDWGCCPNPSLPEIQYGDGECCDTFFGSHMCCPNDYPVCTLLGCTKSDVPSNKCNSDYTVPIKSCPGGDRMCPGYMNCCVNDNGDWDCCPYQSLPEIEDEKEQYLFQNRCIGDLGCFYTGPPFYHFIHRPISVPPSYTLSTQFLLYTPPNNLFEPQVLLPTNESLSTSILDPELETKILIHGWKARVNPGDILFDLKDELLRHDRKNVIIVDWSKDNQDYYPQAVANARAVGAQVAKLINYHVENKNVDPKSVHVIGHSLGGHVSGWAGERVHGLGRITGLDPAGPWFQVAPPEVRLDTTDADFVDIIHTNGGNNFFQGYGIDEPIGHLDFYPNGGRNQPGCFYEALICTGGEHNRTTELIANSCSHSRAYYLFFESINRCHFVGVQCENYDDFIEGKCTRENAQSADMGYGSSKHPTPTEKTRFYLQTNAESPFCVDRKEIV